MSYGLLPEGYRRKPYDVIRSELANRLESRVGLTAARVETSTIGSITTEVSALVSLLWELGEAVYGSQYKDTASGASLHRLGGSVGMVPEEAHASTVSLVCLGTIATVLTVGRRVSDAVTGIIFSSTEEATFAAPDAWTISTGYDVGDVVSNDTGKVYSCTSEGTSAGGGGPTGTGTSIVDGGATWRYIGTDEGYAVVAYEAEDDGALAASAGNMTDIETPVGGWNAVVNPLDATPGALDETDAAFRIRWDDELRSVGNAATEAIRADVLRVEGVTSCAVFQNDTDATDGDGIPPHSVEVLVRGGDDQAILDVIGLHTVATGIRSHGETAGTVSDSQGNVHYAAFTRPEEIETYFVIDVAIDANSFPDDGDDQIKVAMVAYSLGQPVAEKTYAYGTLEVGTDVARFGYTTPIQSVSGTTVSNIKLGTSPAPAGTSDIAITNRQLALVDTGRITVNHV